MVLIWDLDGIVEQLRREFSKLVLLSIDGPNSMQAASELRGHNCAISTNSTHRSFILTASTRPQS